MPFKKGTSGNASGRKAGTKNRTSEEIRQALLKMLDDNLDKLQKDIDSMRGKDRATIIVSLARHCTPPAVNPEKLTEDQLEQILEFLKKQQNEERN